MRLAQVWVLLVLAGAFIGPASSPIGLPDIFWTLQRGQWMLDHRALLDFDPYTSAPHVDGPLMNVQWLSDLLYSGLFRLGGLELVIVGNALAIAAAYGLVLAGAYTVTRRLRVSCLAVALAYLLGFSNLAPRAQTLAYVLFAVFVYVLSRAPGRMLWLLPVVTAVWANVHGSFFVGFMLLGCFAIGQRSVKHAVCLAACVLAAIVTPYGPGSLVYVVTQGSNPIVRDLVTEWAPTTIDWREGAFLFVWLATFGVLVLRSHVRLSVAEMLVFVTFGVLALSSVRAIAWFGLATAPIAARVLAEVLPRRLSSGQERPALNVAIAALVLGVVAVSLPWTKQAVPFLPEDKRALIGDSAPVRVGEYLNTHEPPATGKMLNHETWGGYLDWAAWPKHQPFLDGRIELHPPQVWLDYLTITFPGARWRALLDQYDISYTVLSQSAEPDLIADLRREPGWRLDYEDDQAAVFSRAQR